MSRCGFESVTSARAAGASLSATCCERTGRGTWLPCTGGPLASATPSARARVKPGNFMVLSFSGDAGASTGTETERCATVTQPPYSVLGVGCWVLGPNDPSPEHVTPNTEHPPNVGL